MLFSSHNYSSSTFHGIVRGWATTIKWKKTWAHIKKPGEDGAFLQDTHLLDFEIPWLQRDWTKENDKLEISFPTKGRDKPIFHKPLGSKLWMPSEAKDVQSLNYRLSLLTQHSYLGILISPTGINAVFNNLIYWMPVFAIIRPVAVCPKERPPHVATCWTSTSGVGRKKEEEKLNFQRICSRMDLTIMLNPTVICHVPSVSLLSWSPGGTWSLGKPVDDSSPTKFTTHGFGCCFLQVAFFRRGD